MSIRLRWLCTLVVITFSSMDPVLQYADASVAYRKIVMAGEQAAGTASGILYHSFESPVINRSGEVAFVAQVTGSGVDIYNENGIWKSGGGALNLIARGGDEAPGTEPDVVYGVFLGTPVLNSSGKVAFVSRVRGSNVSTLNVQGIWSDRQGAMELVVRYGQVAPGFSNGANFTSVGGPMFNDAGHISFMGRTIDPDLDNTRIDGLWSDVSGSLELVVREGQVAVGTGEVFESISSRPHMNASGTNLIFALLSGEGYQFSQNQSLWTHDIAGLHPAVLSGDASSLDGALLNAFGGATFGFNDAGQIGIRSSLVGDNIDSSNNNGIFVGQPGSWDLVAREGQHSPGTEQGVYFSDLSSVLVGGSGACTFWSVVSGPTVDTTNDRGIWSNGTGSLKLVFREGDHAPGTGQDVTFVWAEANHVINGAGQVALLGLVTGDGVTEVNDQGIWATLPDGQLTLVARKGDLFDVNDTAAVDDLRTISAVDLYMGYNSVGGEDGHGTSFSDSGELAFRLEFTDGSAGIFVAALPEPGSAGIFMAGCMYLLRRRG